MESTPQSAPRAPRVLLSAPLAIIIAGLLIAGAIIYVNAGEGEALGPQGGTQNALDIRPVSPNDHVYGSREAKVFLVEYSDFECPFCARIHPDLTRIVDESAGSVAWVYRHFPLTSIHAEAMPAAVASECIAKLSGNEKFWEFANQIFLDQKKSLRKDAHEVFAMNSGLNLEAFRACVAGGEFDERVAADMNEAIAAGGNGTPFVVVLSGKDKTSFAGALPYE